MVARWPDSTPTPVAIESLALPFLGIPSSKSGQARQDRLRASVSFHAAASRWILALVAVLLISAVADAQLTRPATITFQDNSFNEDGFIVMRMTGPCGPPGPFVPVATLGPGVTTYLDPVSPFPYACYRAHATLSGVGDSPDSNDYGTSLPMAAPRHRLGRR